MLEIDHLFRKRIGLEEKVPLTFDKLDEVLEKTAKSIPFENICIIKNNPYDISKESLVHKMLSRTEGGLCYELNAIFYLFLLENGFQVSLLRGAVYDHGNQDWALTGRTHVTILLAHMDKTYLVDTGFGGNLPLKPVPLSGETVTSDNGEFRVRELDSPYGNYCLEMKLKHKDPDWKLGYAFDTTKPIEDLTELNEIKKTITESEHSLFNKAPLITRISDEGSMILTDSSFTVWKNGNMEKEQIDQQRFKELAKQHFWMEV